MRHTLMNYRDEMAGFMIARVYKELDGLEASGGTGQSAYGSNGTVVR
jgi:hypothetical protein